MWLLSDLYIQVKSVRSVSPFWCAMWCAQGLCHQIIWCKLWYVAVSVCLMIIVFDWQLWGKLQLPWSAILPPWRALSYKATIPSINYQRIGSLLHAYNVSTIGLGWTDKIIMGYLQFFLWRAKLSVFTENSFEGKMVSQFYGDYFISLACMVFKVMDQKSIPTYSS